MKSTAKRGSLEKAYPAQTFSGLSYPYLVVHLMAGMYQRAAIAVNRGPSRAHVGFRSTLVDHPDPFEADGGIRQECKDLMISSVLEAVRRTRHRMCIVWGPNRCSFVERDGTVLESAEPPSGGFGTGGVGGVPLPIDVEFDRRTPTDPSD